MTTLPSAFVGKNRISQATFSRSATRLGLALATTLLLVSSAKAVPTVNTWTGSTSGDWNTGSNWSGGVPTSGANGSITTFSNAVNTGVTLSSAGAAVGMSFTTASAGAFTIGTTGGPGIVLTTGGTISTDSTVVNTETVNAPLTIGASGTAATYTISSGATSSSNVLNLGGSITGAAASGNTTVTIRGTNTGNNTISGVISNGVAGGTLGITKLDSGIWTLSGNNTYSGGTSVTGTLNINAAGTSSTNSAIGTGLLTIANGSVIDNTSAGDITLATNNALSLGAGFTFSGTHSLSFGTGAVTTTQSGTTITSSGAGSVLTLGVLTNANTSGTNLSLNANGPGTLVLGGINITNGGATVRNEVIGGNGIIIINGVIAPNNTAALTSTLLYNGTGKLILAGANTFTGATSIGTGLTSSTINYQNGLAFGTTSAIVVATGGTAQVQGGITGGNLLLTISGAGATASGATGALENVSGNNSYGGGVKMNAASTISSDSGKLSLSGVVSGSFALTKAGAGTVELSGNNTYNGGTTVNAGTLVLSGNNTNAGGTTVNAGTLLANNATSSTGTGAVNINGGTFGGTGRIATTAVGAGLTAVNIASGATLNPGDGLTTAHLTLALNNATSKVNLANGSLLVFDLGSSTATSDELLVTGGLLVLNNKSFSDFTFNPLTTLTNGTYTLMNDPLGIGGTLGTVTGTFGGGLYTGTLVLTATDLQLQVAVVPEPGTWAMLLGGVALLVVVRRRGARQA